MQLNDITEDLVIQWLHREREGRGLAFLSLTTYAGSPETHGPHHDVSAQAEGCCAIDKTITSASLALGRKIQQKKTQMEAQNA